MRKPFLLLAFLLQLTVHAAERSLEDAYAIAYRFMSSPAATKSSSVYLKMVYDGTSQSTRSCNTAPAYYVFDNVTAPGFVIVSADDAARTILGYSDSYDFEFENMPPNLQWWLGQMNREVEFIRSSGSYAVSSSATKGTPVKLYETAKWNQYAPYNQECPVISTNGKSSNAVTGLHTLCSAGSLSVKILRSPMVYSSIPFTSTKAETPRLALSCINCRRRLLRRSRRFFVIRQRNVS